jgi:hypothetical protein
MKKLNIRFSLISLTLVFIFSSCLDNTGNLDVFNSVNNKGVISIGQAEPGLNVKTVEIKPEPVIISVVINASRVNKAVNVTLEVDPTILTAYNTEQKEADKAFVPFELLPVAFYTIPSLNVAIPAGKLDTPFDVQLATATIDLTKKYALPIVIKSVDDPSVVIASNLNSSVLAIVVKNKYDGKYTATKDSKFEDKINATFTGYYPWKAALVTTGGNSVILQDTEGFFSDPRIHIFTAGTAQSGYGEFAPEFTFDASNKVISVKNGIPSPTRNRTAQLDPTGINTWDPDTKTLKVSYILVQAGTPRTFFNEIYVYTGTR